MDLIDIPRYLGYRVHIKMTTILLRPSQEFWGTRAFILREQGNEGLKFRGTGGQQPVWGAEYWKTKF